MTGTRLALEAVRWLTGLWLLWRIPGCRPDTALPGASTGTDVDDADDVDGVAVVVPARDEEVTLPALLASLGTQQPPPAEVVVVDDASGDDTADVARRAGATVVTCDELPPGWTGKSWACWTGASVTSSATLVFLDADTELEPGGLARVVGEHRRRGGLVSVQPFHVTKRPYERLSAFFNVVAMMGVDAFTPLGRRLAPRAAFGPCLVTGRDDYLAVGGHRAVRTEIVEDVALARRFSGAGRPVTCLGGQGSVRFRMYPGGVAQLVEGWTKNFASGAGAARPLTLALVTVWLSGCISAAWYAGTAVVGASAVGRPAAALLYAAYAGQLAWMLRRVGRLGGVTPLLFPLPLAFFLAVFTRSLVLTNVRGEVRWRGRAVPTGARAAAAPAREEKQ